MKTLVKFLFPKTYKAIYDEGYNACYSDALNSYEDDDYSNDYYDDYYDDHNNNDYDEYSEQQVEEWERECIEEEKALAEIYLPKAPELQIGDKVHLHSKQGMYTITEVYNDSFAYCTKYSEISYANYADYKCHAGGRWNQRGE